MDGWITVGGTIMLQFSPDITVGGMGGWMAGWLDGWMDGYNS